MTLGLGLGGGVGSLWAQETGCGVGWGGRKEYPVHGGRSEQAHKVLACLGSYK